ncbi:MAG: hypothetical protein EB829_01490 [Nitrosopumilus sp. H8]|nr:MAG: hypothetical protein EB830_02795 [Nitrosopumilus sp. H13]RNJ79743.1 MAG: hypothetical protein EB829_01490 [Nitrosopumilus sp. H8]
MLIKLCLIAGILMVGGIVLANLTNPAAGAGITTADGPQGLVDTMVYKPVVHAADQVRDTISVEAGKIQETLSKIDIIGSITNIFTSAFS